MAQICKLERQTEIGTSAEKLFDVYKNKISLMPKISPDKLRSTQVLQGDGKSVGSIRLWTYFLGTPVVAKDKIEAIDEEKKSITFDIIGGDLTKFYNTYKATLQITTLNGNTLAKWTVEYEKANESVPSPHSNIDFLILCCKEVDAYLMKH